MDEQAAIEFLRKLGFVVLTAEEAEKERRAWWHLNDWLAESGYGEMMDGDLRRICGEALALLTHQPKEET